MLVGGSEADAARNKVEKLRSAIIERRTIEIMKEKGFRIDQAKSRAEAEIDQFIAEALLRRSIATLPP